MAILSKAQDYHSSISHPYESNYSTLPNLKKLFGYNCWQWLFMTIALFELISIFVSTCINLKQLYDMDKYTTSPFIVNVTILMICVISTTFLLSGIFGCRQNEICLFLLVMSLCCLYISLEFAFTIQYDSALKLFRLCAALSLTSILMITSKMVAVYLREYSIIGVSPVLLSMYKTQNFFFVLLKFDFLCSISFAIFNIDTPKKHSVLQYTALGVFVLVSIAHFTIGWLAVVKEIKNCLFLFICISIGTILWIPLQFVYLRTCFHLSCSSHKLLLSYGLLVSAIILIAVRIWIFTHLLKVYKNFGYGLADSAFIGLVTETTRLLRVSNTPNIDL